MRKLFRFRGQIWITAVLISFMQVSCTKEVQINNSTSPIFTSVKGTATLVANNSVLSYTLVPGLSASITVPPDATHKVLIQTDGGIQLNSNSTTASGFTDFTFFIDGVKSTSERRIGVLNNTNLIYSSGAYSFSIEVNLSGGTHTIEVKAKKYSTIFKDCYVSSDSNGSTLFGNPLLQGVLNITQFP